MNNRYLRDISSTPSTDVDNTVGTGTAAAVETATATRAAVTVMSDITMSVTMQFHPAAEIFPMMAGADFEGLVADIRDNGQREAIVIYNGMILDGRNRYKACQKLGREPDITDWNANGTPESFVVSKNLHRRHLDISQRAMAAASFATLKRGGEMQSAKLRNAPTAAEAARMFNVSKRLVEAARVVRDRAVPELLQAIERREIKVSLASQLVTTKANQKAITTAHGKQVAVLAKKAVRRSRQRTAAAQRKRQQQEPAQEETQHDRDLKWLLHTWEFACETAQAAFLEREQLIRVSHPIVNGIAPRPQVINPREVAALRAGK